MKVLPFPKKGGSKVTTSPVSTPDQNRLHLGPIGFTCPHCQTSSELHFNNMIFRCVEFHCGSCGNFFKLANPAFTKAPPPPPPPKSKKPSDK